MLSHKNRLHDLECRKVIETICVGKGIDIGSADRPINGECDTLDWNNEYKPTYCCRADKTHIIKETKEWWIKKIQSHGIIIKETPKDWLYANQILVGEKEVKNE